MLRLSVICVLLMLLLTQIMVAQNWSQWRGQSRDAVIAREMIPDLWPDTLSQAWSIEVGAGYSSPVADAGTAYLFTRADDQEVITAVQFQSGAILWQNTYPAPFRTNQYALKFGKGPFATPVLARGKLFTLGIGGILSAYNAESGQLLWRKHFSNDTLDTAHYFVGSAMSPLVAGDRLFVHLGEETGGSLNAYNTETGNLLWQWQKDNPGYASPVLLPGGDGGVLTTLTQKSFVGIDAVTGETRWNMPFTSEWRENIPTPLYLDSLLIISGVKRGITAYRYHSAAATIDTKAFWHNAEISLYMSSPVSVDDRLFGLSHSSKGQFFAIDPKSGDISWISEGRQAWNASLLVAGRWLLALTEAAELLIIDSAADIFTVNRKYTVGTGATWGHPIVSKEGILIHNGQNLTLFKIGE